MIVYHLSNKKFSTFDETKLGSDPTKHVNGHLGIWAWTKKPTISSFGKYLYTLEVVGAMPYDFTVRHLFNISNEDENFHKQLRYNYLQIGINVLRIIEQTNECDMVVCMDLRTVKILSVEEIKTYTEEGN